jgi:hypothetical protein
MLRIYMSELDMLRDENTRLRAAWKAVSRCKLTLDQVDEIRLRHSNGEPATRLAKEFHVNRATIGKIVHGQSWRVPEAQP